MSSEEFPRAERRRRRAEEDVREAHRIAHRMVAETSGTDAGWRHALGDAWSPGERLLHLALTGERVVEGLQVVSAAGPRPRPKTRTLAQGAALRVLLATWQHPHGRPPLPGADPEGLAPGPESVSNRHAHWAAGFLELLARHPSPVLSRLRLEHARYGELDALEWARYLRIYFRHHELQVHKP